MIIKAALHTLRRPTADADEVREAAADIDEEVARLNRVVNDVLDFARPIASSSRRPTSTRSAANRPRPPRSAPGVPAMPSSSTPRSADRDRRRTAAHRAGQRARQRAPCRRDGAARRQRVTPDHDARGRVDGRSRSPLPTAAPASSAADLPRVFDPYFTTQARRHRPRPADRQEHHRGPRRHRSRRQRAGRGHGDPDHSAAAGAWRQLAPAGTGAHLMTTHRGTILLVDDEEKILKALGRALRDDGHEVVEHDQPARGAAAARRAVVRRARRRQRDARADRPRADPRVRRRPRPRASGRRS